MEQSRLSCLERRLMSGEIRFSKGGGGRSMSKSELYGTSINLLVDWSGDVISAGNLLLRDVGQFHSPAKDRLRRVCGGVLRS